MAEVLSGALVPARSGTTFSKPMGAVSLAQRSSSAPSVESWDCRRSQRRLFTLIHRLSAKVSSR